MATTKIEGQCPKCRSGFKTSEFWLCLAAVLVGALMTSGILPAAGTGIKLLGVASAVLGTLGYTASRTVLKNHEH